MSKYLPYSRRALRTMFKAWARHNRRLLALMAIAMVALLALETLMIGLLWHLPGRGYVLGLMHAGIVAAFIQVVAVTFLASRREAIWHLRGAWGEENTREELKRAKRKGLIWGSIDSVNLSSGDIDHLVVTRSGGLVALDSKWRTEPVTDPAELARSAAKVKLRAEGVARSHLRSIRGSHRAAGHSVTVLPAVVLWGPAQHELPPNAQSAGIRFIGGKRLVRWLAELEGQPVDRIEAEDLLRQLEEFRASAWSQKPPTFQ